MVTANDIQIRAATEADVPLLFDLILELAAYEKLSDEVSGDAEVLRRSLFEQRAAEALLIETADGGAVGYAIFFTTFSTFECRSGIWLEDVYVRPEHRRGGIGRAVMEHLAQLAQARGHVRLEWVALDWNEPALKFYEGLGAKRLGDWIIHRLGRDAIRRLAEGDGGPSADEGGVSGEGPPTP
ncbi:MAG TPA: GNAT family N-acetyltransferase [Solirubrobacterales bacterium]|nr:GNAT family N-acetyltransferase [Solirubrobacterales bacterium]